MSLRLPSATENARSPGSPKTTTGGNELNTDVGLSPGAEQYSYLQRLRNAAFDGIEEAFRRREDHRPAYLKRKAGGKTPSNIPVGVQEAVTNTESSDNHSPDALW